MTNLSLHGASQPKTVLTCLGLGLCAGSSEAEQKDMTIPYLEDVMAHMHEPPPSFDNLQTSCSCCQSLCL